MLSPEASFTNWVFSHKKVWDLSNCSRKYAIALVNYIRGDQVLNKSTTYYSVLQLLSALSKQYTLNYSIQ